MAPCKNKREKEYTSRGSFFADPLHLQFAHLLTYTRLLFTRYKDKYLPFVFALFVGNLTFVIILILYVNGALQVLELFAYDSLLWLQPQTTPIDKRITLILTNDEDQRRWGWPLPDQELAQILETLLDYEPVAIGIDLYRDFPIPREKGAGYEKLTQLWKNNSNIIAIEKYRDEKGIHVPPPPVLEGTNQIAFNDLPTDPGGVVRRGLLYMADEEGYPMEALSLKLALHYLIPRDIPIGADPDNPYALAFGKATLVPLTEDFGAYVNGDMGGFQIMLSYPGKRSDFTVYSVNDVLTKQLDPTDLTDKIILIGTQAEATPDFFYLPYGRWLKGRQRITGATLHAYIISQLLRLAEGKEQPLASWHEWQDQGWIWFWSLLSALLCLWIQSAWRLSLTMLGGLLTISITSYVAFVYFNVWIPITAPIFGWILANVIMVTLLSQYTRSQRLVLMQLFSSHVSKELAQTIWRNRDEFMKKGRLNPRRITATVLFTDLQDFSSIAERMDPPDLMDWLNQYMEAMVQVVEDKYHGQVNKFMGDAIMAVFGVPVPSTTVEGITRDAVRAVDCALSMRQEIERLHVTWREQNLPFARMRVGIATGTLVAGSLGGTRRQEYTVIGDVVNIASRLESFDKTIATEDSCRIFLSESTLSYLNNQFETRCVGEAVLKGKTTRVIIHQVISRVTTDQ